MCLIGTNATGESHSIHKCQTFANKSVEDKRKFILDNNLCFGCLRKGHNSKDCRSKATCSICKKHHPTPLHENRPSSAAVTFSHAMQAEQNTSSLSCCVDSGDGGSTSMIVPVWISSTSTPEKEILVYALLDTQSSNTFVDQEVCERIGAISEPVKLKLTTMMGKDSVVQSERVSGLRVRGFSSRGLISLPPAYTRDFIPLERSHIPTPETARRWNHLNEIAQEIRKGDKMARCLFGCRPGRSAKIVLLFTFLLTFAFSFYTHNVCTDHLRQRNTFGHWTSLH